MSELRCLTSSLDSFVPPLPKHQAAEERYATARTQQQAEAAEREGKAAAEELKRASAVQPPLPPHKPTDEELWERRMTEPMYFQVPSARQSSGSCSHSNFFFALKDQS